MIEINNTIAINVLTLLANIAIFGLNLKLYTEILKDKSQDARTRLKSDQKSKPFDTRAR